MCWDCENEKGGDPYKDFVHGKVDPDDGFVETPHRKGGKKKPRKTSPGCPGNDNKAHIYVWTIEHEREDLFYRFFGFPKYQSRICAGCGKKNGSKKSDQYEARKEREWSKRFTPSTKRGDPVPRYGRWRNSGPHYPYWNWEGEIEEYVEYRRAYIARHGWNHYVYGF